MSRENQISEVALNAGMGQKLQILVESQGRINFNVMNDFKGIRGKVKLNGSPIFNWTLTGFPFDHYSNINDLINWHLTKKSIVQEHNDELPNKSYLKAGPTIFYGTFEINSNTTLGDTYLDPTGWGKVK